MNISAVLSALPIKSSSTLEHASQRISNNHVAINPVEIPSNNTLSEPSVSGETRQQGNDTYTRPLINVAQDKSPNSDPNTDQVNEDSASMVDEEASGHSPSDSDQNRDIYTENELKIIDDLKLRDQEVIAHEQAHAAVGGQHAGSPSYSYQTGPDGVKYAVSGEVSIDTAPIPGNPQATLQKAQQIKAAALAPTEPSAQDIKVARKADQMAAEARSEILEDNKTRLNGNDSKEEQQSLSSNLNDSLNIQSKEKLQEDNKTLLSQRSTHINDLYKNITKNTYSHQLDLQV